MTLPDTIELAGHRAIRGSEAAFVLGLLWSAQEGAYPAHGPQTRRPYREVLAEFREIEALARSSSGYIGTLAAECSAR